MNNRTKPAAAAPTTSIRPHIRWMIRRDLSEVLRIERQCFEFPWNEVDYLRCLGQRNCIGMVAEHDDAVAGFMVYELHKTQLRLLNFAVAPECQRQGVGRRLVERLQEKLAVQRRRRIDLEVRETNLPAQFFFRALGFRATEVLKGWYEDTPEDAYVMQFELQQGMERNG